MNNARPFYVDQLNVINFPKRSIYDNETHEVWFRDEGIPTVGIIRGYFYQDHILVFINDYDIPPIHPAVIKDWFNTYTNLDYVELGMNQMENDYMAKLIVFRGNININKLDKNKEETDEESEDLIEESKELDKKETIGFKKDEDSSDK